MSPLICCVCAIFCAVVSGAAETGPAIRHCDRYGDVLDCSGISAPDQLLEANASYANVKHLAIRRSNITFKHDLTKHFPNVRNVTMSGTLVNCAEDVLWLLGWRDKVSDPDDVLCMGQPARSVKKAFKILGLIQYSNDHCPKRCNCTLYHVPYDRNNVTIKDDPMNAHVAVSCGNLGLTELPRVLPENVTSILLDVSNNKVRTCRYAEWARGAAKAKRPLIGLFVSAIVRSRM